MASGKTKKILIVDDEQAVRNTLSEVLAHAGYSVETAADGVEAAEKIEGSSYDLVILDINMPKLDGIDFYRGIQKRRPELKEKFLFITGDRHGEHEAVLTFLKLDRKILIKPFKMSELLKNVELYAGQP